MSILRQVAFPDHDRKMKNWKDERLVDAFSERQMNGRVHTDHGRLHRLHPLCETRAVTIRAKAIRIVMRRRGDSLYISRKIDS
jgi:hypothetical protein